MGRSRKATSRVFELFPMQMTLRCPKIPIGRLTATHFRLWQLARGLLKACSRDRHGSCSAEEQQSPNLLRCLGSWRSVAGRELGVLDNRPRLVGDYRCLELHALPQVKYCLFLTIDCELGAAWF